MVKFNFGAKAAPEKAEVSQDVAPADKLAAMFGKKKSVVAPKPQVETKPEPEKTEPAAEVSDERVQPRAEQSKFNIGAPPKPTVAPSANNATKSLEERQEARRLAHASTIDKFEPGELDLLESAFVQLEESLENKEGVQDAVRHAMLLIGSDQRFVDILMDEEIGNCVRAVRESYGVAIVKKQARATKKTQTKKQTSEIMAELADMNIDIGSLKVG